MSPTQPRARSAIRRLTIAWVMVFTASLISPFAAFADTPPPDAAAPVAAMLTTDKTDYAPTEVVQISGSGFEAGAIYALPVRRPDGSIVVGDGSFAVGWDTAAADASGALTYAYTLDGIEGAYEARAYPEDWSGDWSLAPLASATFSDSVTTITITGVKYEDLDASHTAVVSESKLPGWTIKAWTGAGWTTEAASTTTDANGAYSLTLPRTTSAGAVIPYLICEEPVAGWTQTRPYRTGPESNGGAALHECPSGEWGWYQYGAGDANNNFLNYHTLVTGTKFDSLNGDGVKDPGDPGVQGITVKAFDATVTSLEATTQTDANGLYSFVGLTPLVQHLICEFPPAAWVQTHPGNTLCSGITGAAPAGHLVTPVSSVDNTGNDFGQYTEATKSGFKFEDLNANGFWDDFSEGPLEGWWIFALDPDDGSVVAQVQTDVNGAYSFSLAPGQYLVCEEVGTDWFQSRPWDANTNAYGTWTAACPDPYADWGWIIELKSGDHDVLNNFGNYQLADISGLKFHDRNADGDQDAGEPGLGEWTINLIGTDGASNPVALTTTTAADGTYSFPDLVPGTYTVDEDCTGTWRQSFPAANSDAIADCGTGTHSVTLVSGVDDVDNVFGNYRNATKSGWKFEDLDANGVWNDTNDPATTEPGINGWKIVALQDATVIETLTVLGGDTAAFERDGYYKFDLKPGSYLICEELPAGWLQSRPPGSGQTLFGTLTASCPDPYAPYGWQITLKSGDADTLNNFGNYEYATKSGVLFEDEDADGTKDASDTPIEGWTVSLTGTDGKGNAVNLTTQTSDIGAYSFGSLVPGHYVVALTCAVGGWRQSLPATTEEVATCGAGTYDIWLASGQLEQDNDFAVYRYATKSGTKFHDLNANGVWDEANGEASEPVIEGWKIVALQEGQLVDETWTDENGDYSLSLKPGSYLICEELPAGWHQSRPPDDGLYLYGTWTANCPGPYAAFGWQITLGSGDADTLNNFGNYQNATKSGYKFHDLNANGVWDDFSGEEGMAGWKIVALDPVTNEVKDWTLTDENGFYEFSLKPGSYLICEEMPDPPPTWYQSRPWNADSYLYGTWTDECPTELAYGPFGWRVTLQSQDVDTLNNFGNYQNATKAGTKFHDLNANGRWDEANGAAIEPTITGWEIFVLKASDQSVVTSMETGAFGRYEFSLKPGEYLVCEELPDEWLQSRPWDADLQLYGTWTDACPDPYGPFGWRITLESGDVDLLNNFGNYQLATKSGTKFHDLDANGIWDESPELEPVLEGFTIAALQWVNGAWHEVDTTTTAANGSYSFDLKPGEYLFCEVMPDPPPTWYQSRPPGVGNFPYGGLADECPAGYGDYGWRETLVSGGDYPLNNFGNYQHALKWGYKFHDVNRNGVWNDATEPGLAGWKIVALTGANWGTVIATTYTDAEGYYAFSLKPGEYLFCEKTNGWTQSRPAGVQDYPYGGWSADCPDGYAPYGWRETLVSGAEYTWNNFGNYWDEASLFTDSSFCTWPLEQFRLTYHIQEAPNIYQLQASNPGQFYYHAFYAGTPGTNVNLSIEIPFPFVTQGSNPIQVHDFVTVGDCDGCLQPGAALSGYTIGTENDTLLSPSGMPIVDFDDYASTTIGSSTTVSVSGVVPDTGLLYVTIHLDYGFKKTGAWTMSGTSALGPVQIDTPEPYAFSFNASGPTLGSSTPTSFNEFKKPAGFLGVIQNLVTGEPLDGVRVDVYNSSGTRIGTVYTDADGYYLYAYKHKAKAATYTVKLPNHGMQQSMLVKANGFGVADFDLP